MFTGIVQEKALIEKVAAAENSSRLEVVSGLSEAAQWALGDSIAVNGVCLTIVEHDMRPNAGTKVAFDVSSETLARTGLGALSEGDSVHLERALRLGDPLGGHWVSGHIDGVARVSRVDNWDEYKTFEFELTGDVRAKVAPYLVEKGSIAVDGVSLTVNSVRDTDSATFFEVMCIPHTLEMTRFGTMQVGDAVNLEADLLAKYVCRNTEFQTQRQVSV